MTINKLIDLGVHQKNIKIMNIISVHEGIDRILATFPEVIIYTAQVDESLNDDKYICPGLGDFGDRYYNSQDCFK